MKKATLILLALMIAALFCGCGMTAEEGIVKTSPAVTSVPEVTSRPGNDMTGSGGMMDNDILPNPSAAPGSGSVMDDSTLVSPSPMPTTAPATSSPTVSAAPSDNGTDR